MAWLSQQGVEYEGRDITQNRAWIEDLQKLGSQATPTTIVEGDGGKRTVIIGFRQAELKQALGL